MAATGRRLAWGYWPGSCNPQGDWLCCYRPQVDLGVLAWLLHAPGWPEILAWLPQAAGLPGGTGMAAAAHRGYWHGCYSSQYSLGVLAWLLQAPGWPEATGLAVTGPRLAWMYWPGCYRPQVGLGILGWLLHAPGSPGDTGLADTGHRLAWGIGLAAIALSLACGYWAGC